MVTLQQLLYFRALAANGHLTRTAESLYISQTTLSNTIINLEKQLGVKLFDRVGRNLQLSPIGKQYLAYVTRALDELENGLACIDDHREKGEQKVSLTTSNSLVWADLIRDFQNRFRSYALHQLNSTPDQFRRMLLNMEIDYVITGTDDMDLTGLEYEVFQDEQLYLCIPKGHPLEDRNHVQLQELRDERFINLPQTLPFRKYCDNLFEQAGIQYNAVLECDYMLRGQLIEAGFGVCLTTHSGYKSNFLGSSNVYIPLADDVPRRPIALIWNPKRYLGQAARDFRDYVMSTASRE